MKPDGITVISDIDDTIKISHSYDRTRLLRHTFLKPFAPVPGMADRYRRWAEREQVDVVYLSNSPWQLYVPLQRFMARAGFPAGPVDLLRVQLDDERLFNLFDSPTEKKLSRIQTYLRRYPNRTFVLIGDSGEADPEIYGTVARQHPDQVRAIFIRRVRGGHDVNRDRFQEAFHQVPEKTWTVFDDPAEMTIQRLRVK
jgi:phosphatidate phosphatase APP1